MTTHYWGEKDVDWDGIEAAATYLGTYCKKYGRLGGQTKEKFGTVRFYADFGCLSLHSLIYPGYCYSQFPKWLWILDCNYIGPILRFFFEKPFVMWQKFIYNKAYWNALNKYPHLRAEILCDADYPEFIKGVTRKEEDEYEERTTILGWNGEKIGCWVRWKKDKPKEDNETE